VSAAIESGQSTGVVEVTPSGIPVYYQSKPKRCYLIGPNPLNTGRLIAIGLSGPDLLGYLTDDWREVPSVTTVLGVLDKPALPWWGMTIGVQGVFELIQRGVLLINCEANDFDPVVITPEIVDMLTEHKLTVNHVRDKAGNRGQAVHDAFEAWARTGLKPDPSIFPDEERGYVEGLLAFLADVPTIEPLAAEVLVASVEHGFAGRYDIRFRTSEPHDVVVHRTPKKGPQYRRLAPGIYLGDLKTSKGIYASHSRQLEAYEQASIESGYEPTVARGILHVGADGTYEFVRSWATFEDFRVVLDVWQSDQEMKERK
jgi:hypothetical protein